MHSIIESLPIVGPRETELPDGGVVRFRERQIVIWVSVTPLTVIGLPPRTRRFPAILDTGFNSTFTLSEEQLVRWAGVLPSQLREFPSDRAGLPTIKDRQVPAYEAAVWLHPNVPGKREPSQEPPFWTLPHPGILVLPAALAPRLPLIGLRMIEQNALHVRLDPVRAARAPNDFALYVSVRSSLPPLPGVAAGT